MLTGSSSTSYSSSIILNCALCINPQDADFTPNFPQSANYATFGLLQFKPSTVNQAVIFLSETNTNTKFATMALANCSIGTWIVREFGFDSGDTLYLQSISKRSDTASTLVDIALKRMPDADYIRLIIGLNPFDDTGSTLSGTEYTPVMVK